MSTSVIVASNQAARRRSRSGRLVLGLFLLSAAGLLGLFLVFQKRDADAVAAHLAALKAAGEPMTAAEIDAYYVLPAGRRDCTQLYVAGIAPFQSKRFHDAAANLPLVGYRYNSPKIPLTPGEIGADLAKVEQFLSLYQPQLELLHEAARLGGGARYPILRNDATVWLLPHMAKLRDAGNVLQLESVARAARGDAHGAAESIRAMWRAGQSMEYEPWGVSRTAQFAIGISATAQLQVLLSAIEFSDEDLRMLQAEFRTYNARDSVARLIRGERALEVYAFDSFNAESLGASRQPWLVQFLPAEKLNDLEQMKRLAIAADLPTPQSRIEIQKVLADAQRDSSGGVLQSFGKTLASELLPGSHYIDFCYSFEARYAAIDASLAAELFRRQQGRWPAALDELVPDFLPAVPLDPFDGQPLRIVTQGDDLVINSIGADGADDAGQESQQSGSPDISFRLTLPAAKKSGASP